jgi:hypothetical protein
MKVIQRGTVMLKEKHPKRYGNTTTPMTANVPSIGVVKQKIGGVCEPL